MTGEENSVSLPADSCCSPLELHPTGSQTPFRRQLRWLMRPTFVAAKVGKTAHAAKAPGKLRRVPCVSRPERPVPNSLPCGRSDMRNRTSPFATAILGAVEADGVTAERWLHVEKWLPNVMSPHPAVAAAEHCRAGRKKGRRMSERRERSDHSEFGGPRPDRNAQGTGPEAAPAAVGPAASPGSVSWLLLGAPRSNSHQPAKPAAKLPLTLIACEAHKA